MTRILIILFCLLWPLKAIGEDMVMLIDLSGKWKFAIGDDQQWASKNYNDASWDQIRVPGNWEDNGFYGYNGYAWYRKSFTVSEDIKDIPLYLVLGYIDDVDEVYLNGQKIGFTGQFPPNFSSAYSAFRKYYIPSDLLITNGQNVISVRVYDTYLYGGIVKGDIGIYSYKDPIPTDISLSGKWKFQTGDNPSWKNEQFNDDDWPEIFVPIFWENQGYRDYDGFAWYRKDVLIPTEFKNERMVLVLGRIDDIDQVFLNGKLVGQTGDINKNPSHIYLTEEYRALRGYYIPDNVIHYGEMNTIAVRVYDAHGEGGIYEGTIGLVRQTRYVNYWRRNRR